MSLLHHAWVSQEGMSEAYNESHKDSKKVELFNDFLRKNKKIGSLAQFNKVNEEDGGLDDELDIPENDLYNEGQVSNSMQEMHRKNLSQAMYAHLIREELKERNKLGKILFGPRLDKNKTLITYKASVEQFLAQVDTWRTEEIYEHTDCTGMVWISW